MHHFLTIDSSDGNWGIYNISAWVVNNSPHKISKYILSSIEAEARYCKLKQFIVNIKLAISLIIPLQ